MSSSTLFFFFIYNFAIITPPKTIKGEQAVETNAILQDKTNERTIPITKPREASDRIATVSVVNPFILVISSERMLLKIPGALSFESNQPRCLCSISVKSYFLN